MIEVATIELSYKFSCFGIWQWVVIYAASEATIQGILALRAILLSLCKLPDVSELKLLAK